MWKSHVRENLKFHYWMTFKIPFPNRQNWLRTLTTSIIVRCEKLTHFTVDSADENYGTKTWKYLSPNPFANYSFIVSNLRHKRTKSSASSSLFQMKFDDSKWDKEHSLRQIEFNINLKASSLSTLSFLWVNESKLTKGDIFTVRSFVRLSRSLWINLSHRKNIKSLARNRMVWTLINATCERIKTNPNRAIAIKIQHRQQRFRINQNFETTQTILSFLLHSLYASRIKSIDDEKKHERWKSFRKQVDDEVVNERKQIDILEIPFPF